MRVVLVDPSRTMRLFVTRLLQARDHEVLSFADGAAALACMRQDLDVSALITSGELGAMSGLELCWETRVLAGRDRPIYVILMSSSIDRSRLGEALDSGADDFISKPPVADELYARLRAAERLGAMQRELVRLASVDPLTDLHNRRGFFELAEQARGRGALCGENIGTQSRHDSGCDFVTDARGAEQRYPRLRALIDRTRLPPGLQLAPAAAPIPPAVAVVSLAVDDDRLIVIGRTRRHIGLPRREIDLALDHRGRDDARRIDDDRAWRGIRGVNGTRRRIDVGRIDLRGRERRDCRQCGKRRGGKEKLPHNEPPLHASHMQQNAWAGTAFRKRRGFPVACQESAYPLALDC